MADQWMPLYFVDKLRMNINKHASCGFVTCSLSNQMHDKGVKSQRVFNANSRSIHVNPQNYKIPISTPDGALRETEGLNAEENAIRKKQYSCGAN